MNNNLSNKTGGEMNAEKKLTEVEPATDLRFRDTEKELILDKKIRSSVRLGDRRNGTENSKGGYAVGSFFPLKIQNAKGEFDPYSTDIVIKSVSCLPISKLDEAQLKDCPPDEQTKDKLIEKLSTIYQQSVTAGTIVSLVQFEYLDNLKSADDLIRLKVLTYAKQPADNPESLNFPVLNLPLIEHDYPAKTPIMWNSVYHQLGINAGNVMLVGDPSQARQIFQVLRQDEKYQGGGAGVGFKDEAIKYLDELDPLAKAIGSINFILKTTEGKLRGFNTDGIGYAMSLEEIFQQNGADLAGKKAVILGAGGTGNSIAFALAEKGMKIVILNRTISKAEELADRINQYFDLKGERAVLAGGEEMINSQVVNADAVINVSTKGSAGQLESYSALAPAILPATKENIQLNQQQAAQVLLTIPKTAVISDIVLVKEATMFLKTAQTAGFKTLGGIPMVVNQGVEAFWLANQEQLMKKGVTKDQVALIMKKAAQN